MACGGRSAGDPGPSDAATEVDASLGEDATPSTCTAIGDCPQASDQPDAQPYVCTGSAVPPVACGAPAQTYCGLPDGSSTALFCCYADSGPSTTSAAAACHP